MTSRRLTAFLDANGVEYEILHHRPDFTAQETAEDTHTPGREFAKTVILDVGVGGHAMAVVPAVCHLDLERIRHEIGTSRVRLADESEMRALCPDCEVGAAPPFGNLYAVPVFVDPSLAEDEYVTFNAGSHDTAVRMRYSEFRRLVAPTELGMVAYA